MAKLLGKDAIVALNGVNISVYVNQTDLQRLANLLDSETYQDVAKERVLGMPDASLRISGPYSDTASEIDASLNTALTTAAGVLCTFYPAGNGTGKVLYGGTCFASDYTIGAPVTGLQMWSATLSFSNNAAGIVRSTMP